MYILAIETTGASASVAVISEEGLMGVESSQERLNHLQNLMTMTQALLDKSKLAIGDITGLAVSTGPGSFTGIRIGVSTARALAQALEIGVMPVPTLKAFAYNVTGFKGIFCPIFDARREQIYAGAFSWNEERTEIQERVAGGAYSIQAYFDQLEQASACEEILFFGDGVDAYESWILAWMDQAEKRGIKASLAPEEARYQQASSVARLALDLVLSKNEKMLDFEQVKPVYMRKAEAERKLEEGSLKCRT